jgi:hypothetical protein
VEEYVIELLQHRLHCYVSGFGKRKEVFFSACHPVEGLVSCQECCHLVCEVLDLCGS